MWRYHSCGIVCARASLYLWLHLISRLAKQHSTLFSFVCLHLQLLELAPKTAKGHGRAGEASWQCLHSGCLEALLQVLHKKARDLQPCSSTPETGQALRAQGHMSGSRAGEQHAFPCTHLQWLHGSAAPGVTTDGARLALKVGECTQLQKTSPLLPTGSSKSGWWTKANVVTSKSC